jgi:hypothetical protein
MCQYSREWDSLFLAQVLWPPGEAPNGRSCLKAVVPDLSRKRVARRVLRSSGMHIEPRGNITINLTVAALLCVLSLVGLQAGETITATAHVASKNAVQASAAVSISVDHFSTDAAREELLKALKKGGTAAVRELLGKTGAIGSIKVGSVTTAVKYAYVRTMGDGRLITAVTDKPIAFIGASAPNAPAKAGFELGLVLIDLPASRAGTGELVPAAKIRLNELDAIVTDDYSGEVVRLSNVIAK